MTMKKGSFFDELGALLLHRPRETPLLVPTGWLPPSCRLGCQSRLGLADPCLAESVAESAAGRLTALAGYHG